MYRFHVYFKLSWDLQRIIYLLQKYIFAMGVGIKLADDANNSVVSSFDVFATIIEKLITHNNV